MSNHEWDIYMAILRDRSDDPSVWARNKLQQMADRIHALTAERDEMQRELRKAETECSMLRVECGVLEKNAETTYENHKRIVAELTAERDEARRERLLLAEGYLSERAKRNGFDCHEEAP